MLQFFRKYPALLVFGVLTAAFSSPGQTFLASLFIPSMRRSLDMSPTEIAGLFAAATLLSSVLLPIMGHVFDRSPLWTFTLVTGILLAAGCAMLGLAWNAVTVLLGFLLIRNLGQGTMVLISSTTMARIFGPMRGKALGITNLGFPLGEMIFPVSVSAIIAASGWRMGWHVLAGLLLFVYLPAVYFLLRRDTHKRIQKEIALKVEREEAASGRILREDDWTLRAALKDWRFYALILPVLTPAAFFTALFFHQADLLKLKGWDPAQFALGLTFYGFTRAMASFAAGPMVDRWTAVKTYPLNLIPVMIGLCIFLFARGQAWIFGYLGFCGVTMGLAMTIGTAVYAELYGVRDLGAIRGFLSSIISFSTAVAPVILGHFLDQKVPLNVILAVMIGLSVLGTLCSLAVAKAPGKKPRSAAPGAL
ncbi:MAG: MFS transporter [Candidatus Omnitrophota bacterium]